MNADSHEELQITGSALLRAVMEFWKVHQKLAGPRAVVWLEDTSGHFVLFTRGEYKEQVLLNIRPLSAETPLKAPFIEG